MIDNDVKILVIGVDVTVIGRVGERKPQVRCHQ